MLTVVVVVVVFTVGREMPPKLHLLLGVEAVPG